MKLIIKFIILSSTIITFLMIARMLIDKCEPYFFTFKGGYTISVISLTFFLANLIGYIAGIMYKEYFEWLE